MTGSAVRVDGMQGITPIWPVATAVNAEGALTFHGRTAESLLDEFGSPLYLIDTDEVSARARYFVRAAADAFTNSTTHVSFAGKAFLSKEVVRLVTDAGMLVDTCSMGEMRIALAAGVPGRRLVLHGNNKSEAELRLALTHKVGRIVVDSTDETSIGLIAPLPTTVTVSSVVAPPLEAVRVTGVPVPIFTCTSRLTPPEVTR